VPKEPPHPKGSPPDEDPAEGQSDRPTINPPFDVEAFARATASAGGPSSSAKTPARGTPRASAEGVPETRGEQITLTNEVELEIARAKSRRRTVPPRRALTPTALSMANSRVPSVANMPAVRTPPPPGALSAAEEEARSLSPSSIEAAVLGAIVGSPAPEITERTIDDPIEEMRERFSLGDYTGALEMAELLLTEDPGDKEILECADKCRLVLEGMYAARLGSLAQIPAVIVQRAQLRWLSIDHRAGFVLSLIDGSSTLEMILDVSGMPKLDSMRILLELIAQRIVALR
jgi:hypothetical protein